MAFDYIRDFGNTHTSYLSRSTVAIAKPSRYQIDGAGRDSYIDRNNGGLYTSYFPAAATRNGGF